MLYNELPAPHSSLVVIIIASNIIKKEIFIRVQTTVHTLAIVTQSRREKMDMASFIGHISRMLVMVIML